MSALGNRARETTQTTGATNPYQLDGPTGAFQSLVEAVKETTGQSTGPWTGVAYCVFDDVDYEMGKGTLAEGTPDTLNPTSVESSTNGDSRVDWSTGQRTVFIAPTAKQLYNLLGKLTTSGLIERTGEDAYAIVTVSSFVKNLLDDGDAATARATLGAQASGDYLADVFTTRGDLLFRGASAEQRLAKGTEGQFLRQGSQDPEWSTDFPLPPGHQFGMWISNNGSDLLHDIDLSQGSVRDFADSGNLKLSSSLTKAIDSVWVQGSGGGFPSGLSLSANTWYYFFAIRNPSTGVVDGGFDTSLTASNLIANHGGGGGGDASGFTQYRRRGSIRTDASADILPFTQYGDHFVWANVHYDFFQTTDFMGGLLVALDYVPIGYPVLADVSMTADNDNSDTAAYAGHADTANPSDMSMTGGMTNMAIDNESWSSGSWLLQTNASAQIRIVARTSSINVYGSVRGWFDSRGGDA